MQTICVDLCESCQNEKMQCQNMRQTQKTKILNVRIYCLKISNFSMGVKTKRPKPLAKRRFSQADPQGVSDMFGPLGTCVTLRNLAAYFPMLNQLPKHVSDGSQPGASITYHKERVSFDPDAQEVHVKIPLDVFAKQRSFQYEKKVTRMDTSVDSKGYRSTHKSSHWEWAGCDGTGYFQASVALTASFDFKSSSLYWEHPQVMASNLGGDCFNWLPAIKNYDVVQLAQTLQQNLENSWMRPAKRSILNLAFGGRLFLEFQTPRIVDKEGIRTISGSVLGCVQDSDNQVRPIGPSERSLQKRCFNQLLFDTFESKKNQPIMLDRKHLVFRWHGSPKVAIHIENKFEQVMATIAEGDSGYNRRGSTVSVSSTSQGHSSITGSSQVWHSFVPGFVGSMLGSLAEAFSQRDVVRFAGHSQNVDFWLSIDDATGEQKISLGRGKDRGQKVLVQKTIKGHGPLNLSLSSLDTETTWHVNSGQTERVCEHGMPTALAQGHGAVRLSTQVLGAVLGVQSQHLKNHVSKKASTVRDAKLNYSLQVGEIKVMVANPAAVAGASFLDLSVANSSTIAHCDGRPRPLLSASLDYFQGPASLVGRKERDGNLTLSMAFTENALHNTTVKGLLLRDPSVPISQSGAKAGAGYVLGRLIPDVNDQLSRLALVLPNWLAQFIPCELGKSQEDGRCQNSRLLQHGSFGHEMGFVEFSSEFPADVPVPKMLLAHVPPMNVAKVWRSHPKLATSLLAFSWLALMRLAFRKSASL